MISIYVPAYIPSLDGGHREILNVTPRWKCFSDPSNSRAIFIDGQRYHQDQLFRTPEAVRRYFSKMSVPASDRYTVAEVIAAWEKEVSA